jgi:hypothetical protein
VVEGARLESEYTPKAYRGFESLPLRQKSLLGDLSRTTTNLYNNGIEPFIMFNGFAAVRTNSPQTAANIMTIFMT